jgi:P27 family predicted phage terminase small subunit
MRVVAGSVRPNTGAIFPPGRPVKPKWLQGAAKTEWERVIPLLEDAGLLSEVDLVAISAYCQAWAELVETTKQLEKEGRVIQVPIQSASGQIIGHNPKSHPAVRMQRDAFNRVNTFLSQFGFSPVARARLSSAGKPVKPGATATPAAGSTLGGIRDRVEAARQAGA